MSKADKIFINMCRDIIDNGISSEGEEVRARWEDGTPAHTIKRFGVVNRYDLREEFPILTLRKTAMRSAIDELLWIWQKKSNNIKDLNSSIWDEWADENGSIGKAYGYQIGKRHIHTVVKNTGKRGELLKIDYKSYPSIKTKSINGNSVISLDQIDGVLWDLKNNPFSRRIMTNIYNFDDLHEMNLYPCAYSMTFNVTKDKDGNMVLNGVLNQRSQDVLAANNWNVVQYSILLHMLAQCNDMIAGELVHVIADCHIYDRHIPLIEELISREPYEAPRLSINPDIKNFYDFEVYNFALYDYYHGKQIENIPIAI